jgi:hypothetical protein
MDCILRKEEFFHRILSKHSFAKCLIIIFENIPKKTKYSPKFIIAKEFDGDIMELTKRKSTKKEHLPHSTLSVAILLIFYSIMILFHYFWQK